MQRDNLICLFFSKKTSVVFLTNDFRVEQTIYLPLLQASRLVLGYQVYQDYPSKKNKLSDLHVIVAFFVSDKRLACHHIVQYLQVHRAVQVIQQVRFYLGHPKAYINQVDEIILCVIRALVARCGRDV